MKKRFLGILSLILALCLCTAVSASAQAPGKGDVARPQTVYTGANGTIENSYGELQCTLTKRLSHGYAEAYVQANNNSGTVDCFIRRPNGAVDYVGVIPASGGSTGSTSLSVMESGVYTFIFYASTAASLSVYTVIRD